MNYIPTKTREQVRARARNRCERCGVGISAGHIHHRRSRSVHDEHTHHPCNCVLLCGACHVDVHAHPFEARTDGWIVSRHEPRPGAIPMDTPFGPRTHGCDGSVVFQSFDCVGD